MNSELVRAFGEERSICGSQKCHLQNMSLVLPGSAILTVKGVRHALPHDKT